MGDWEIGRFTAFWLGIVCVLVLAPLGFCEGNRDLRLVAGAIETIELSELPEPPVPIAKLIEFAKVRFIRGPREDAVRLGRLRSATLPGGRPVAGVTEYRLGYHFRSSHRWRSAHSNDRKTKAVTVNVVFSELTVKHEHTIWLSDPPLPERFWSDRVVLHELDHVRLSSDPRLAKRFAEKVLKKTVFTIRMKASETVDENQVNELVERHVKACFKEVSDLAPR